MAAGLCKAAASIGFIGVGLTSGARRSRYGSLVLLGLAFSWFGDVFLVGSSRALFLAGLVSFLGAHLAYIGAFSVYGVHRGWLGAAAVASIPGSFVVLSWLLPHVDDGMKYPVLAYFCVITVMVVSSVGALGSGLRRSACVGAVLFYLSDLAVARGVFVVPGSRDWLWGLPLYYLAQVLLATSVASVLEEPRGVVGGRAT